MAISRKLPASNGVIFCPVERILSSVDKSLIPRDAQPATYRVMTHADENLLGRIKRSREFLSACLVEAILDPDDDGDVREFWFGQYTNGFRPFVPRVNSVSVEGFDDDDDDDGSVDSLSPKCWIMGLTIDSIIKTTTKTSNVSTTRNTLQALNAIQ